MTQPVVVAQVILRKRDGSSILDSNAPMTAETIAQYRVEVAVRQEAKAKLEALGFSVTGEGATGFTITGEPALFEQAFQTTLTARHQEEGARSLGAPERPRFMATRPFQIPADLASLVADVSLPVPPELFS